MTDLEAALTTWAAFAIVSIAGLVLWFWWATRWKGHGHCMRCNRQVQREVVVCGSCGYNPTKAEHERWWRKKA